MEHLENYICLCMIIIPRIFYHLVCFICYYWILIFIGFIEDYMDHIYINYPITIIINTAPLNIIQTRVLDAFDNVLENSFIITPLLIVPMYAPVFYLINICNIFWGFYLHSNTGHKMPYWFLNDSNKHNIHHKYGIMNYNYAFYFSFWDKICGTYRDVYQDTSRQTRLNKVRKISEKTQ